MVKSWTQVKGSLIALFSALLGVLASPGWAHEFDIPYPPFSDSVAVRLLTQDDVTGDVDIEYWWVEVGSTGVGSGRNDIFDSGLLDAPTLWNPSLYGPGPNPNKGAGIELVTGLPVDGRQVYISMWIKRFDQGWLQELLPVTTAVSVVPTPRAEGLYWDPVFFSHASYTWTLTEGASWYQVWFNDADSGDVYSATWYRHEDVCADVTGYYPDRCGIGGGYIYNGQWWVRAWSVSGGYGPWSNPGFIAPY